MEANPPLHPRILLYDLLYIRGSGRLWFYDDLGNFIICVFCRRGARQDCVLGTTIMCITIRLVYDALLALIVPDGFLFSYADDVYMGSLFWWHGLSRRPLASTQWLASNWGGARRRLNWYSL
jgi:hypothetical protein